MRNQKLLLGLLIVLFAGLCLVMLVFSGGIYALGGLAALIPTLALPSAPFCVLQLALCKYCKGKLLPKLWRAWAIWWSPATSRRWPGSWFWSHPCCAWSAAGWGG